MSTFIIGVCVCVQEGSSDSAALLNHEGTWLKREDASVQRVRIRK